MPWKDFVYSTIGAEVSAMTRYFDRVIHWDLRPGDEGFLHQYVQAREATVVSAHGEVPELSSERNLRAALVLNGAFNHHHDIEKLLTDVKPRLGRNSRLVVVAYNPYFSWLYRWANRVGLRKGECPSTFVTKKDLANLTALSGYQVVSIRPAVYCPWKLFGFGNFINKVFPIIPVLNALHLVSVIVLRPIVAESPERLPSLSIVIPARNERGNIENALKRLPNLGVPLEVIFIEGHSNDGTWEEIERVVALYAKDERFRLLAARQTGKGKGDAVRLGFSMATHDLLTILDADLTMPPELLGRFTSAYNRGLADFINGTRLVYPMEGEAMRFLNLLGNVFFAKGLSYVLGTQLGDSLCGTKLVARHDYQRFIKWRSEFGDFDPFGDFELLFPAAVLGLGVVDIPIRYRARTYGATNISRFRHGLMLLKMTTIGFLRLKLGRVRE